MATPGSESGSSSEVSSREHLATVTYLFGAVPTAQDAVVETGAVDGTETVTQTERQLSPGGQPARAGRLSAAHPVFRDEAPVALVESREASDDAEESAPSSGRSRDKGKFERVSNVSMYALARRGMSSREMRDYLIAREFGGDVVDEEVARLEGVGLLDDDSLAETLVRTLRDRKGLGRQALTAELRRRHVDGAAIEEAMSSLDDDELERATAVAVKRAPQVRSLDSATAQRRLSAFLMRKGYSGSVVSAAVKRALEPSGPTFR